jgi:hypothetical protein
MSKKIPSCLVVAYFTMKTDEWGRVQENVKDWRI